MGGYIRKIIDKVSNKILNGEVIVHDKVIGIILTGSIVHGVRHPNSDLDLHIIVESKEKIIQNICFVCDNTIVQLKVYSFEKFKADCLVHERKRPAAYACKIQYDPTGQCGEYIKRSQEYLLSGPRKLTDQEKSILITTLKTEILAIEGLLAVEKNVSATLIMNDLVRMAINYYNDENSYWISNDNYLYNELEEHDVLLGELAEKTILCCDANKKLDLLKELCHRSIKNFKDKKIGYNYEEQYE